MKVFYIVVVIFLGGILGTLCWIASYLIEIREVLKDIKFGSLAYFENWLRSR